MVLYGNFSEAALGQAGALILANWRTVLVDANTFRVFFSTILIALPRTIMALVLATMFTWIIARTTTPGKWLLTGLLVFMFFLPELPWVLAWILPGAPTVGFLNQWLHAILPGDMTFIKVYSYAGLIILGATRSTPVLFLFIYPAFQAMDTTLEEAAPVAGLSDWRVFWPVSLPLLPRHASGWPRHSHALD